MTYFHKRISFYEEVIGDSTKYNFNYKLVLNQPFADTLRAESEIKFNIAN